MNSKHELLAQAIVEGELPGVYMSTSCEVVDVIREYERFSTTAMNGYVGPKTAHYIRNLADKLREALKQIEAPDDQFGRLGME